MPITTRRRQPLTESFAVSKRLSAHEAKFPKGAEIGFTRSLARSTRNTRFVSYSESDDEDDEDEDEYEEDDEQEETKWSSDSDIEEIPMTRLAARAASPIVESAAGKAFKGMATEVRTPFCYTTTNNSLRPIISSQAKSHAIIAVSLSQSYYGENHLDFELVLLTLTFNRFIKSSPTSFLLTMISPTMPWYARLQVLRSHQAYGASDSCKPLILMTSSPRPICS